MYAAVLHNCDNFHRKLYDIRLELIKGFFFILFLVRNKGMFIAEKNIPDAAYVSFFTCILVIQFYTAHDWAFSTLMFMYGVYS